MTGRAIYYACITANIVDGGNGAARGRGLLRRLDQAGPGRLVLSGTNTYTGIDHGLGRHPHPPEQRRPGQPHPATLTQGYVTVGSGAAMEVQGNGLNINKTLNSLNGAGYRNFQSIPSPRPRLPAAAAPSGTSAAATPGPATSSWRAGRSITSIAAMPATPCT